VGGETTNSRRAKRGSVQFRLSKHFDNKKNWMFGDSVKGSKASANLYSLIETAKANGIEPYTYLRNVFEELPKADSVEAIEALLPWHMGRVIEGSAEQHPVVA
jgi:hypothetical protein